MLDQRNENRPSGRFFFSRVELRSAGGDEAVEQTAPLLGRQREPGADADFAALAAGVSVGKVRGPFCPQPASSKAMPQPITRALRVARSLLPMAATTLGRLIRMILSTMAVGAGSDTLDDSRFQQLATAMLGRIESQVDRWLQDDVIDIDTHRSGGLLELAFPNGSKIIVNTQPPLRELWLAAKAGGFHYRWSGEAWVDTRDGSEFLAALSQHASAQGGVPLLFTP